MKVKINNREIEVVVTRKNRKTISIKISESCEIIICAPLNIDDEKVKEIIKDKEEWVAQSLKQIETKRKENVSFKEGILYLGIRYTLDIHKVKHKTLKIIFDNNTFNIYISESLLEKEMDVHLKELLTKWYRVQARRIFQERVNYYSSKLKVSPKRMVIKDQKSRWGSCSSKGNINLNYRLIMAPIEIIDYVIVHELCHLVHLNHSKEFWALVKEISPNYLKYKEWLKNNGNMLNL
jgi:predicted metal-dependent hydrolase